MGAERRARLPWLVTGTLLAAAWALNALRGNGLWLAYTSIGIGFYLALLGLVRHAGWRVPPAALWWGGTAASLHYVGGSLSGLHRIGGPNGLYYVFPWWDNAVHLLGATAAAVLACAALRPHVPQRGLCAFLAASVATLLGVLVELYEFGMFVAFGTVDQGFYTNTMLDLYDNLLGAVAGAYLFTYVGLRGAEPAPAPAAASG